MISAEGEGSETPENTVLGFVGLGQMGSLMAERLLAWPGGLVVYDIRPEASERLSALGARAAESVRDLARSADIIGVMVLDDDQVREVFADIVESARPGTVVAVHSTIRPSTAEQLERLGRERDVEVLDAPVSGGVIGAQTGRLALLVGGSERAFAACRGPFGFLAEVVSHFGPVGSGTRAKLARNLVNFVGIAGALEAARLAQAAGLDVAEVSRITIHTDSLSGGPGVVMIRGEREPLGQADPLRPIFAHTSALGEKDLALALELGEELGIDLPLAMTAHQRLAEYMGVPHGLDES